MSNKKPTAAESFLNNAINVHVPEQKIMKKAESFLDALNATLKGKHPAVSFFIDIKSSAEGTEAIIRFKSAGEMEFSYKNLLTFFVCSDPCFETGSIETTLGISDSICSDSLDFEQRFKDLKTGNDYIAVLDTLKDHLRKTLSSEDTQQIEAALKKGAKPQQGSAPTPTRI